MQEAIVALASGKNPYEAARSIGMRIELHDSFYVLNWQALSIAQEAKAQRCSGIIFVFV